MTKKLIIFDLDGTLLNTIQGLTESTNSALKFFNYPQKTQEEIKSYIGNGVFKLIERAIPGGINNENLDRCVEIFKLNYEKNMYNNIEIYPGILASLKDLKALGLKIAVISNKFDLAVKELCNRFFPDLIDFAIGENDAGGLRKKPAPDMVLMVLDHLKINSEESIFIGDSEVDIETAKNSGLKCISVTWGYKSAAFLKENGAEILVNSPQEIKQYLYP